MIRIKTCLSNCWCWTLPLDLLLHVAQKNDSLCPGVDYILTLVTPGEQEAYWRKPRRKNQTYEQGPLAGQTVMKVSLNVRVKKMQQKDEKIKELLNEHIRKRPHSPGNPPGLYSGVANPSRVCGTRQGSIPWSYMFHLPQQSGIPMYSSRNCKADPATRSFYIPTMHTFVAHKKI